VHAFIIVYELVVSRPLSVLHAVGVLQTAMGVGLKERVRVLGLPISLLLENIVFYKTCNVSE